MNTHTTPHTHLSTLPPPHVADLDPEGLSRWLWIDGYGSHHVRCSMQVDTGLRCSCDRELAWDLRR